MTQEMTEDRKTFENYPGRAGGRSSSTVATGPDGPGAGSPGESVSRRGLIGFAAGTMAGLGVGAVGALVGLPLWAASATFEPEEAQPKASPFDGLDVGEDFIGIGSHAVQIPDGWLAEATGPESATLSRGDNRVSLWVFELEGADPVREIRSAVTRFDAVPRGVILALETGADEFPAAYAGGTGTWRGKPVQVVVELSTWYGRGLITALWLTDPMGSRTHREGARAQESARR